MRNPWKLPWSDPRARPELLPEQVLAVAAGEREAVQQAGEVLLAEAGEVLQGRVRQRATEEGLACARARVPQGEGIPNNSLGAPCGR